MTITGTETLVEVDTIAGRVRGRWRSGCRGQPPRPPSSASRSPSRPSASSASPRPCRTAPWEGVRDAAEFGADGAARRPRRDAHPRAVGPRRLDAERERLHADAPVERMPRLPVLVYIHGGGYFAGSPASPWYDGAAFNRDGVVTVSISYRLGFDGFGWIADAPTNRGVLDWLLALEWVRDNIAAFGGDPARVTIAGQSAGGGAVLTLLGMPSGPAAHPGVYSISGAVGRRHARRGRDVRPQARRARRRRADRAGLSSLSEERILELQKQLTDPAAGGDPMDLLRELDRQTGSPLGAGDRRRPASRSRTIDAIAAGVGADKPLVLGATDDEFSMILDERQGQAPLGARGPPARQGRPAEAPSAGRTSPPTPTCAGSAPRRSSAGTSPTGCSAPSRCASPPPEATHRPGSTGSRGGRRTSAVPCTASTCRSSSTASTPTGWTRSRARSPPQALADDVHGGRGRVRRERRPGLAAVHGCRGHRARLRRPDSRRRADAFAGVRPLLAG